MTATSSTNSPEADDARRITARDFERARYRVGGQPVSREAWQAAAHAQLGKQRITILIDGDVLAAFKAKAGELDISCVPGYIKGAH